MLQVWSWWGVRTYRWSPTTRWWPRSSTAATSCHAEPHKPPRSSGPKVAMRSLRPVESKSINLIQFLKKNFRIFQNYFLENLAFFKWINYVNYFGILIELKNRFSRVLMNENLTIWTLTKPIWSRIIAHEKRRNTWTTWPPSSQVKLNIQLKFHCRAPFCVFSIDCSLKVHRSSDALLG